MITLSFNNYPLFITENKVYDSTEIQTMAYYLDITRKEEHLTTAGECENIPCGTCPLAIPCKNGRNITLALTNYVKSNHPELFI